MRPIGIIQTPYKTLANMPIQSVGVQNTKGCIEIFHEYTEGLKDLDGFSHLFAIYHFHKSNGYKLTITPFLDKTPRGLFSTRAPKRPNPIGLSIFKIISIEKNFINISGVDVLDKTPLLDIKPYIKKFDIIKNPKCGWIENNMYESTTVRSDERFK